jgi:hypothetical protein
MSEITTGWEIRPPRGIEFRICRMLLPEMEDAPGPVWHRVAVDPSDGRDDQGASVSRVFDDTDRAEVIGIGSRRGADDAAENARPNHPADA